MANGQDGVIRATVELTTKGRREVVQLSGTIKDLDQSLKDMSRNLGANAKKQLADFRKSILDNAAAVKGLKRQITEVEAVGVGTRNSKSRIKTKEVEETYQKQLKLGTQLARIEDDHIKALIENEKRLRAEKIKTYKEQMKLGESMMRDEKLRSSAIVEYNRREAQAKEKASKLDLVTQNKKKAKSEMINDARIRTAGFLGLSMTYEFSKVLDNFKSKGLIAPVLSTMTEGLGGLLGSSFGKIFGDLGDAVGKFIEVFFDSIAIQFKAGLKLFSGIMSGLFISLIAFNPLNLLLGGIGGIFTGFFSALGEFVKDAIDIIKNFLSAIGSLLKAGFEILRSVFDAFSTFVTEIWKGLWEGLKSIVVQTMEALKNLMDFGFQQMIAGFKDFVEAEKLATKSFVNIIDVAKEMNMSFGTGVKAVDKLADRIRMKFGTSLKDTQDAIYDLMSAGMTDLMDVEKILGSTGQVAAAGQDSLKDSIASTLSVMLAYNKSATDVEQINKTLFAGAVLGRGSLTEFNKALPAVINQAHTAEVSFEELAAAIDTISLSGISYRNATVGLNRLLLAMTNPTKNNSKAMRELGLELTTVGKNGQVIVKPFRELFVEFAKIDPSKLRQLFGTSQGIRAFQSLNNNAGKFSEILKRMPKLGDELGEAAQNSLGIWDSMFSRLEQIGSVIRKNVFGPLFDVFKSPFGSLLKDLEKLEGALSGKNVEKFFKSFADFMKPLVDLMSSDLSDVLGSITEMIQTGDFDKLFKTEGMLTFRKILIDSYQFIKQFPEFLGYGLEILKVIGAYFKDIFSLDNLTSTLSNLFTFIYKSFMDIGKFIVNVLTESFKIAFDIISGLFGTKFVNTLITGFKSAISFLREGLSKAQDVVAEQSKNAGPADQFILAGAGRTLRIYDQILGGLDDRIGSVIPRVGSKDKMSALTDLLKNSDLQFPGMKGALEKSGGDWNKANKLYLNQTGRGIMGDVERIDSAASSFAGIAGPENKAYKDYIDKLTSISEKNSISSAKEGLGGFSKMFNNETNNVQGNLLKNFMDFFGQFNLGGLGDKIKSVPIPSLMDNPNTTSSMPKIDKFEYKYRMKSGVRINPESGESEPFQYYEQYKEKAKKPPSGDVGDLGDKLDTLIDLFSNGNQYLSRIASRDSVVNQPSSALISADLGAIT